jgi:hypothetical protein
VPPHSPGTWALSRWSTRLRALNANPADKAAASATTFFAYLPRPLRLPRRRYIVTARSALGASLGPVAQRKKIQLNYGQELGRRIWQPARARHESTSTRPVFDTCADFLLLVVSSSSP